MPPMQKRILYQFTASIVAAAVLLTLLPALKLSLLPALLLIFAVFGGILLVTTYLTRAKPDQPVLEDERDKAIARNVPAYVTVGLVLATAGWLLVLAFLYGNEGHVPFEAFDHVELLVPVVVSTFAGVMIEYWRAKSGFALTPKWKAGAMIAGTILITVGCVLAMMFAPDANSKIKPRFTSTYMETNVGVPVRFIDTSVGDPIAWEWDFGDGATSREQNPTHTYSSPGRYTVQMTAYGKHRGIREAKEDYMTVLPAAAP
jgi:hypothetical protein